MGLKDVLEVAVEHNLNDLRDLLEPLLGTEPKGADLHKPWFWIDVKGFPSKCRGKCADPARHLWLHLNMSAMQCEKL